VATASSTSSAVLFNFAAITGGYTIRNQASSQYVSAENYGASALIANRPTASSWETFLFVPTSGYWAIEAIVNNKYVALQTGSGNQLIATQALGSPIPDIALFSIVTSGGGGGLTSINIATASQIKLYSKSTNLYITVGSGSLLVASAGASSGATTFRVGSFAGGYTLQSSATNQFASADNYGANPVVANRPTADTWETFFFTSRAGGTYSIQSYVNNQLVSVQANGQLIANVANSGTIPDSALFYVLAP